MYIKCMFMFMCRFDHTSNKVHLMDLKTSTALPSSNEALSIAGARERMIALRSSLFAYIIGIFDIIDLVYECERESERESEKERKEI